MIFQSHMGNQPLWFCYTLHTYFLLPSKIDTPWYFFANLKTFYQLAFYQFCWSFANSNFTAGIKLNLFFACRMVILVQSFQFCSFFGRCYVLKPCVTWLSGFLADMLSFLGSHIFDVAKQPQTWTFSKAYRFWRVYWIKRDLNKKFETNTSTDTAVQLTLIAIIKFTDSNGYCHFDLNTHRGLEVSVTWTQLRLHCGSSLQTVNLLRCMFS